MALIGWTNPPVWATHRHPTKHAADPHLWKSKACGQCRRPLARLEAARLQAAASSRLRTARLQGCRLQGVNRAQKIHTNITEYFPKTGFDVLPAVLGHRATSHD